MNQTAEHTDLTADEYKQLEDKRIHTYVTKHNDFLKQINEIDLDTAGSVMISKMEYLYSQAQIYAYLIAGHYRKFQKYHEALAEQAQADSYEDARLNKGQHGLNGSTDGQYLSRKAKGLQLEKAARFEGDYIRWNGIAKAYENAINSLKDLIKAHNKENNGGV
jgi:hypothetical protein